MRYYVLREDDGCGICKEWENLVNPEGGSDFGDEDIEKGTGEPDQGGLTHLFHRNCKCTLVPSPDGIPIKDTVDKNVLLRGALGHVYFQDKTPDERLEMLRKYDV